jgi:hypothetical protein
VSLRQGLAAQTGTVERLADPPFVSSSNAAPAASN